MGVNTAPYSAEVEQVVRLPFTTHYQVTAYVAGRAQGYRLTATSARVSIDGRRAPRWTATVEVAMPSRQVRAVLDPRQGLQLDIEAGYDLPGGRFDMRRLARLRVDTVTRDVVAGTMLFGCVSDESTVIDYPFDTAATVGTADVTRKVTAIKAVIQDCFSAPIAWTVEPDVNAEARFQATQTPRLGSSRWDSVTDWAESIDAKVYSDGAGRWTIARPPRFADAVPRARLRVGTGGTVSALQVTDSRLGGYANRVLLQYVSRSGSTTTQTTVVAQTALTPPRMLAVTRNRPVEDGPAVARTLLKRALRRSHAVTVEAPAHYWLRPGHTLTVDDPDGQQRVMIETVDLDVVAGVMRVTGRQPPTNTAAAVTVTVTDQTTT